MRRRTHQRKDYRQTLQEFSRSLALIVDEDELHEVVAAKLGSVFAIDRVTLFRRTGDGAPFRLAASRGLDPDQARDLAFPPDGRLAAWLRVNEIPLVLDENPGVVEFLEMEERDLLARLGIVACFPLVAMNRLSGFLGFGPARGSSGFGLAHAERELLATLAAQAALALDNAALMHEQRSRLKRLYRAERLATAGELAAGAAHEIRNPLTSIRSAIQYIRSGFEEGGDRAALLDEVLSEADRIDGIVEGLLSFARPQEATLEPVDMPGLIRQSAALISARARTQNVSIHVDAPDTLRISADPNLLKQLLLNILLNGLQAMPDGGDLRILLAVGRGMVDLSITDTGSGIPERNIERIFDPFFTTKSEGTGLGLSICYGIVERHGGEMEVASREGHGTTMMIRLPQRRSR